MLLCLQQQKEAYQSLSKEKGELKHTHTQMATMRRLSDVDVRAIFESLHGNEQPPPHLKFQIVPVGANGLRLSPPSYAFEGK